MLRFHHNNPQSYEQNYRNQRPEFEATNRPVIARTKELFCETCDRDFRSPDQLAEHRQQHQRCGIDGCLFEAHEAIVSKHIQQQHNSGLYDKIKNLQTPEDIAKWREERRKRFPTKENMEMRQQIQEAKQQRGERLEDSKSRFGQKGDRRNATQGSRQKGPQHTESDVVEPTRNKKKRRKRKQLSNHEKRGNQEEKIDETKVVDKEQIVNGSLVMFGGTKGMKKYTRPRIVQSNALSGLLGDYGSDESDSEEDVSDEDDPNVGSTDLPIIDCKPPNSGEVGLSETHSLLDDKSTEVPKADDNLLINQTNISNDANYNEANVPCEEQPIDENDDEAPEEATVQRVSDLPCPAGQDTTCSKAQSQPRKRQRHHEVHAMPKKAKPTSILDLSRRYRNQNTMLEKLLQKDIRHERNVLLQCVRYVVDNKFFGIGQLKADEESIVKSD